MGRGVRVRFTNNCCSIYGGGSGGEVNSVTPLSARWCIMKNGIPLPTDFEQAVWKHAPRCIGW